MGKTRNSYADMVKALAVLTVIIGHNIQCGSGYDFMNNELFYDDVVFRIIYSFHMPLFMLVSGYFFCYSMKRHSFMQVVRARVVYLMVPVAVWAIIPFVKRLVELDDITLVNAVVVYIQSFVSNLWFLWVVFGWSIFVLLVHYIVKEKLALELLIYGLTFMAFFFVPDFMGLSMYKYMFPFFIAGYLFNHCDIYEKVKNVSESSITLIAFVIVYIGMAVFFRREDFIQNSGYTLINNNAGNVLFIDMFRMILGFVGSIMWLLILKKVYGLIKGNVPKVVSFAGANTMGIYIISVNISLYLLPMITGSLLSVNYGITCLETVIITAITLGLIWIIKKIPILYTLLLGGR